MPRNRNKTFLTEGIHYKSKKLTCCQILNLISEYPYTTTKDLSKKYNISPSVCNDIAVDYYNIKKDKTFLLETKRNILNKRNKELGRDLTKDFILKQGLKYSSKREWSSKDPSSYTTANRLGIMEEATKHMVNISFSVPQIILKQITEHIFNEKCSYNNRRVIKPYELDIYFEDLGIAFEYDGLLWHKEDKVDKFKLCEDNDILLITIVENSRKYIEDIKQQLVEHIDLINNNCELNIKREDIINYKEPIDFPKLFTDEELSILRNNDSTFLYKNYYNLYMKYRKYNPDKLEFKPFKYDEEFMVKVLDKFEHDIKKIYRYDTKIYQALLKRFKYLIKELPKKRVLCKTTGVIFENINQVCDELDINKKYLLRVLSGGRKKVKNMEFEYYD